MTDAFEREINLMQFHIRLLHKRIIYLKQKFKRTILILKRGLIKAYETENKEQIQLILLEIIKYQRYLDEINELFDMITKNKQLLEEKPEQETLEQIKKEIGYIIPTSTKQKWRFSNERLIVE